MTSPAVNTVSSISGPIGELAARDIQLYLSNAHKYVKCKTCKDFFPPSYIGKKIHAMECTTCNHIVAFCNDCGGEDRALKGIRYHVKFYMRETSVDDYGNQHAAKHRDYLRASRSDKVGFKILKGGRA